MLSTAVELGSFAMVCIMGWDGMGGGKIKSAGIRAYLHVKKTHGKRIMCFQFSSPSHTHHTAPLLRAEIWHECDRMWNYWSILTAPFCCSVLVPLEKKVCPDPSEGCERERDCQTKSYSRFHYVMLLTIRIRQGRTQKQI